MEKEFKEYQEKVQNWTNENLDTLQSLFNVFVELMYLKEQTKLKQNGTSNERTPGKAAKGS